MCNELWYEREEKDESKMAIWEFPVLCVLSVLCGIKSICGLSLWKGETVSISKLWTGKRIYVFSGVWLIFYIMLWLSFENDMTPIRIFDLLCTYVILAVVDAKYRIVPDSILLVYFAGQMLLGALSMDPSDLLRIVLTGLFFSLVLFAFIWFSKGKMGMGDGKLLGVTAMTAGWQFALQSLFVAIVLSFIYSMWLLIICKKSIRTEIPFVPFLTAGMAFYIVLLV